MNGNGLLFFIVVLLVSCTSARADLLPDGVAGDNQTSIAYDPDTGQLAIDAPFDNTISSIAITSADGIFSAEGAENIGSGIFDEVREDVIFKAAIGGSFGSLSLGFVAPPGLTEDFILFDLSARGTLFEDRPFEIAVADPRVLGPVDLIYGPISRSGIFPDTGILQPGDADQDLDVDQLDLVKVLVAGKFLSGASATWGEGDWNGAPGGRPGSPPSGDGLFDQIDIVAALLADKYLTGSYAAIRPQGGNNDEQTSVVYDANTGEVAVDAPASRELTSINITSAARNFTAEPAQNLGGNFDNVADDNIFKATFGSSFGSLSLGNVAQIALWEESIANDLTVIGSLAGGGDLGDVDLVYIPVPEPGCLLLLCVGLLALEVTKHGSRI